MKPRRVENNKDGPTILWATVIDAVFVVEVYKENYCTGVLHIFEITDSKLIHVFDQPVTVKCNRLNWPDHEFIAQWRSIATTFIEGMSG